MDPLIWSIVFLVAGIGLVLLEIFVPSGGILGGFAALSLIASVWVGFTGGTQLGTIMLAVNMVVVPLVVFLGIRVWPNTPFGERILGRLPSSPDAVLPDGETYRSLHELVGKHGVAKTTLRPSGDIIIDGKRYDAISEGMAIDQGQPIRVIAVRTNRPVVSPAEKNEIEKPSNEDVLAQPFDTIGVDPFEDE